MRSYVAAPRTGLWAAAFTFSLIALCANSANAGRGSSQGGGKRAGFFRNRAVRTARAPSPELREVHRDVLGLGRTILGRTRYRQDGYKRSPKAGLPEGEKWRDARRELRALDGSFNAAQELVQEHAEFVTQAKYVKGRWNKTTVNGVLDAKQVRELWSLFEAKVGVRDAKARAEEFRKALDPFRELFTGAGAETLKDLLGRPLDSDLWGPGERSGSARQTVPRSNKANTRIRAEDNPEAFIEGKDSRSKAYAPSRRLQTTHRRLLEREPGEPYRFYDYVRDHTVAPRHSKWKRAEKRLEGKDMTLVQEHAMFVLKAGYRNGENDLIIPNLHETHIGELRKILAHEREASGGNDDEALGLELIRQLRPFRESFADDGTRALARLAGRSVENLWDQVSRHEGPVRIGGGEAVQSFDVPKRSIGEDLVVVRVDKAYAKDPESGAETVSFRELGARGAGPLATLRELSIRQSPEGQLQLRVREFKEVTPEGEVRLTEARTLQTFDRNDAGANARALKHWLARRPDYSWVVDRSAPWSTDSLGNR